MGHVIGLDLGSNSIGWAVTEEVDGEVAQIVDAGVRIFNKSVNDDVPTPKNVKRRNSRLARRTLRRRAGRKQKMINYLVNHDLLPITLKSRFGNEQRLNQIGDPYYLRVKALNEKLEPYELGRILLHFAARRGFLSNKKILAGDIRYDDDVISYLETLDQTEMKDKEESAFKSEIALLRSEIEQNGYRTLGEYLYHIKAGLCKRNRSYADQICRTDRQMYKDELMLIWEKQSSFFTLLKNDFIDKIEEILFYQRPILSKSKSVGNCSLEIQKKRAKIARLECQRFRYLQQINILRYDDLDNDQKNVSLSNEQRNNLKTWFEFHSKITKTQLRSELGLHKKCEFNIDEKIFKGNITACKIRTVIPEWDTWAEKKQYDLVEDLLTIQKKSTLKRRLITYWKFPREKVIKLCLLEFEPGHSNHSTRAIRKLLPFLEEGHIYSKARELAGYGYEKNMYSTKDCLGELEFNIPNPIVQKGLHELRRVFNAILKEYGRPAAIRIEMARDLEMNTKRFKNAENQRDRNRIMNKEAQEKYAEYVKTYPELNLSEWPTREDRLKYRLWIDQKEDCVYSGKKIPFVLLFTASVEVDHILPFSMSLDDSYMNKVLCFKEENQKKRQQTPIDAYQGQDWYEITQRLIKWNWRKTMRSKFDRFYKTTEDIQKIDLFQAADLNDTRYICKVAKEYLQSLGADIDISVTKGKVVSAMRHQWGLNSLLGKSEEKDRTDHRHHAIDAIVIALTSRSLYGKAIKELKINDTRLNIPEPLPGLRNTVKKHIDNIIISFSPLRKLYGALHEDHGASFNSSVEASVYRKPLSPDIKTAKNFVEAIIDETVKQCVSDHLRRFDNNPKKAFSSENTVFHIDGKTPIKRVRVRQSNTTYKKLTQSKLGIRDKNGNIFRWMSYGNIHHVEILCDIKTGKYSGEFVTMCEASQRSLNQKSKINKDHGANKEFVMALHINDLVSVKTDDDREYYRVQALEKDGKIILRLHTASTTKKKDEKVRKAVNTLMKGFNLQLHKTNVLGKLIDD